MPLLRPPGVLLLRYADLQFDALLFQCPPRIIRYEARGESTQALPSTGAPV